MALGVPIDGLIDSTVIIDVLRGHAPAAYWASDHLSCALTVYTWFEVLAGARSKRAQLTALDLLRTFTTVYPEREDYAWAERQFLRFALSYNIGQNDCLIAAAAQRLNVPLYTHNLKHMQPLIGALAVNPY
jgi:predicted nucleic acid-binding protein